MRPLKICIPGTGDSWASGGLWSELRFFELLEHLIDVELVTYEDRERGCRFLQDILAEKTSKENMYMFSWGYHIKDFAKNMSQYHLIYHAHSSGYDFVLPPTVPIISVSRNTMGFWGQAAPNNHLFYLPHHLSKRFDNLNQKRNIDVLCQVRKSSSYLLDKLIPALRKQCRVELIDHHVNNIAAYYNRSKIYLYDSTDHWRDRGVSEGFGLPPFEAMCCGCTVFSSVNDGLSDYLEPGLNCQKIRVFNKEYDIERILTALKNWSGVDSASRISINEQHNPKRILSLAQLHFREIDRFFTYLENHKS